MKRLIYVLCLLGSQSYAQVTPGVQTLTNVDGWNVYVYLPAEYNSNPSKYYPAIIFQPGDGEVGTTATDVIKYGPGAYIKQGWNGEAGGQKFIVISMQPPNSWTGAAAQKAHIDVLRSNYRIGKMFLTGLSMGGRSSLQYSYSYPNEDIAMVTVAAVYPDSQGTNWDSLFTAPVAAGQKYLMFKQTGDYYGAQDIYNAINAKDPTAATFITTTFGSGGHCCWDNWYGGNGTTPQTFAAISNQNIYQWMASQVSITTPPPVVSAGSDKTISSGNTILTGTATAGGGSILSYAWSQISGPTATIVNPANVSTTITGLADGEYTFRLTATQTDGQSAYADIKVTVTMNPLPITIRQFFIKKGKLIFQ